MNMKLNLINIIREIAEKFKYKQLNMNRIMGML